MLLQSARCFLRDPDRILRLCVRSVLSSRYCALQASQLTDHTHIWLRMHVVRPPASCRRRGGRVFTGISGLHCSRCFGMMIDRRARIGFHDPLLAAPLPPNFHASEGVSYSSPASRISRSVNIMLPSAARVTCIEPRSSNAVVRMA